jgi:hypothetical protein
MGTGTITVLAVRPVSGGERVTMQQAGDPGLPAKPVTLTYMFYSDGSISVPFTPLGATTFTIKSGSIIWPPASVIASGQPRNSTLVVSVKAGGQAITANMHVTVRGAGIHKVTVPAGTYQATEVDETAVVSILGHTVKIEGRNWMAPGVGPVKLEIGLAVSGASPAGATSVAEELKSFTK